MLGRIFRLKKRGIDIQPIYLIYRTTRLNKIFDDLSEKAPRFWRIVYNIGIAVGFGEMLFAIYLLTGNLLHFLYAPGEAAQVFLIVPGVTIRLFWLPYLLIAVIVTFVTHEVAHGIAACLGKISIKSVGIIFALVIPIGFVEQDQEEFKKARFLSKLRVISAGSLTNLCVGILTLLLLTGLYAPASGVLITELTENGPSEKAGLQPWDVIYAINQTRIRNINEMNRFMSRVRPGDTLILNTSSKSIEIKTEANPSNKSQGIIGVTVFDYHPSRIGLKRPFSHNLYLTMTWMVMLAINLAMFNMLPIYPLDGDVFVLTFLERYIKEKQSRIRLAINILCLALVITNVTFSFMKYGIIFI